jgi:hypothetical protein
MELLVRKLQGGQSRANPAANAVFSSGVGQSGEMVSDQRFTRSGGTD